MKYRRKPVEIEAFQFDGDMFTSDGKYYVPEWAVNTLNNNVLFFEDDGELYLYVEKALKEYFGSNIAACTFFIDKKSIMESKHFEYEEAW